MNAMTRAEGRSGMMKRHAVCAVALAVTMSGAAGGAVAQPHPAGPGIDQEPSETREVAGAPTAVLDRSVVGAGGGSVADLVYLIRATVGQVAVYSPFTLGPQPYTHRVCSGWWCTGDFTTAVDVPDGDLPKQIAFGVPYPNPGSGDMRLGFALPRTARVEADLIDVTGRRVRSLAAGSFEPGEHTLEWNGRDAGGHPVQAGVYFLRVRLDGREIARRRVVVVR